MIANCPKCDRTMTPLSAIMPHCRCWTSEQHEAVANMVRDNMLTRHLLVMALRMLLYNGLLWQNKSLSEWAKANEGELKIPV